MSNQQSSILSFFGKRKLSEDDSDSSQARQSPNFRGSLHTQNQSLGADPQPDFQPPAGDAHPDSSLDDELPLDDKVIASLLVAEETEAVQSAIEEVRSAVKVPFTQAQLLQVLEKSTGKWYWR